MVQTRIAESGFAPLLAPVQNPPGMPPGGLPRTSALAYSLLWATYVRVPVGPTAHLWSCAFSPQTKIVQDLRTGSKNWTGVMCRCALSPQGKKFKVLGSTGQASTLPGLMVSQVGGAASFAQFDLGFFRSATVVPPMCAALIG